MRWFYCYYAQILSRHPALPHVYRLSRHKNKKYLCTSASSSFPPQKYPGISASSFVCLTHRLTCGPWPWPPPPAVVPAVFIFYLLLLLCILYYRAIHSLVSRVWVTAGLVECWWRRMLVALVMSGASLSCRCDDILIHSDKTMRRNNPLGR